MREHIQKLRNAVDDGRLCYSEVLEYTGLFFEELLDAGFGQVEIILFVYEAQQLFIGEAEEFIVILLKGYFSA